ncbi:MAG: hypothetical protein WA900_09285, partial [Casimicrobiaceae bacterium]
PCARACRRVRSFRCWPPGCCWRWSQRRLPSRRRLWILDEPLTALDSDGADVLEALLATQLDGGGIVVAASHQPLPIEQGRLRRLDLALAHHG